MVSLGGLPLASATADLWIAAPRSEMNAGDSAGPPAVSVASIRSPLALAVKV